MRTAYAVAFDGERFLMVFNPKRDGWEMPGGHVEDGESSAEAARREFAEEAGYDIDIVSVRDIGYCDVCAAFLGRRIDGGCEMESELFTAIPDRLSFDREEYEDTVPWARSVLGCIVELKRGETYDIRVEGNATTGYMWRIEACTEGLTVSDRYECDAPKGLAGAGGTHVFTVSSQSGGRYDLTVCYGRAWEDAPIKRRTYSVIVS